MAGVGGVLLCALLTVACSTLDGQALGVSCKVSLACIEVYGELVRMPIRSGDHPWLPAPMFADRLLFVTLSLSLSTQVSDLLHAQAEGTGQHAGVGGFWAGVTAAATAAGYADEAVDSYESAMMLLETAEGCATTHRTQHHSKTPSTRDLQRSQVLDLSCVAAPSGARRRR